MTDSNRPLRARGRRFEQGEKVLCYEPDPNKVKVVYEAKIIEIRIGKDDQGKRRNEYLVHFHGWNSAWDRYVLEDMLLKDTEEGRAHQQELLVESEKIQNKSKKKKSAERRLSDKSRLSCDSNEDSSVTGGEESIIDEDDDEIEFNLKVKKEISEEELDTITEPSNSPHKLNLIDELQNMKTEPVEMDEPEDVCTDILPLTIPDGLKKKLEHDHHLINARRKLTKLPAQPNVANILELFVRSYAIQKLSSVEKQLSKSHYSQFAKINSEKEAEKYEEAANHINICKEVAEGVRIIIDFHLGNILLYRREEDQFSKSKDMKPKMENINTRAMMVSTSPEIMAARTGARKHGLSESEPEGSATGKKRTRLSSNVKEENNGAVLPGSVGSSSGTVTPTLPTPGSGPGYPQSSKAHAILEQLLDWKLVPDTLYLESPAPPSLIYGGIHLARLLVKIPDILVKMRFSVKNAKKITKHLELLTDFLNNQEIFTETCYQ